MADLLANMEMEVLDENLVAYSVNGLPRKWEAVAMYSLQNHDHHGSKLVLFFLEKNLA